MSSYRNILKYPVCILSIPFQFLCFVLIGPHVNAGVFFPSLFFVLQIIIIESVFFLSLS